MAERDGPTLNPTQQRTLDMLGAGPGERPQFDPGLGDQLESQLVTALVGVAELVGDAIPLFVSKHRLAQVHACERKYVAEVAEPFEWSAPIARGSVSHKAIELALHTGGEPVPLDLVDEALARLAEGTDGLADWLQTCSDLERAELRALAAERVTTFLETFPPLKKTWHPLTEGRIRVELHGGRIVLQGRVDLSLGRATGTTAGKVLIDLKTGSPSPTHLDDLRFYALIETIRLGVPPRLLANFYLDTGRPQTEVVTQGLLESALVRTADGATKIVEIEQGIREPVPRPGPACRWCPVLDDCAEGTAHLAELDHAWS